MPLSKVDRIWIILLWSVNSLVYSPRLLDYFLHSRFVCASLLLACTCLVLLLRRPRAAYQWTLLDTLLLAFALWNFVSLSWAGEFSEALFYCLRWLLLWAAVVCFRYLMARGQREDLLAFLGSVARWMAILVALVVIYHLALVVREHGYSNTSLYEMKVLFGHKSITSFYLFLLIPLSLVDRDPARGSVGWPAMALVALLVLLIVALQSRAVYVCLFVLAVSLGVYVWRARRLSLMDLTRLRWVLLAIVGVVVSAAFLFPELAQRFNPLAYAQSQTATERRLVWIKTRGMVAEHPWLGVGAGNWKLELPGRGLEGSYRMQDQNVVFTRAHNDFLEILAEVGLVGFVLYCAIFCLLLWWVWRLAQREHWLAALLGAGLVGFVVVSLIDFPRERIELLVTGGLYAALLTVVRQEAGGKLLPKSWTGALLILLLCSLAFSLFVGIKRYQGERKTVALLQARVLEDWNAMVELSEQARNPWYVLDPSASPIKYYEGVAHYRLGALDRAQLAFEQALAESPYNFHVLNNLATVHVQRQEYEEALPLYERALQINDRFEDALFNVAFSLSALGRHKEALTYVRQVPTESQRKQAFLQQIQARINGE